MCGLVGVSGNLFEKDLDLFIKLLKFDSARGEHSTGLASLGLKSSKPTILKKAVNGFEFVQSKEVKDQIKVTKTLLMGHNRHATKGQVNDKNAHPFQVGSITGVHNGTLSTNYRLLLPDADKFGTDSEAIFNAINEKGIEWTLARLHGAYALIWHDAEDNTLNFIKNDKRPLHYGWDKAGQKLWWSSDSEIFDLAREYSNTIGNLATKGDYMYPFVDNVLYRSRMLPSYSKTLLEVNKAKHSRGPFFSIEDKSDIKKVTPPTTTRQAHSRDYKSHFKGNKGPDPKLMIPFDKWDSKTKKTIEQEVRALKDKKDRERFRQEAANRRKSPETLNQEDVELKKAYGYSGQPVGKTGANVIPFAQKVSAPPTTKKERDKLQRDIEALYKTFHIRGINRWNSESYTHHLCEKVPSTWMEYSSLKKDGERAFEEAKELYKLYRDSYDIRSHKLVLERLKKAEYYGDIVAFTLTSHLIGVVPDNVGPAWDFSLDDSIKETEEAFNTLKKDIEEDDFVTDYENKPSGFKDLTNLEYENFIAAVSCSHCNKSIPLTVDPSNVIPLTNGGVVGPCCADSATVNEHFGSGKLARAD